MSQAWTTQSARSLALVGLLVGLLLVACGGDESEERTGAGDPADASGDVAPDALGWDAIQGKEGVLDPDTGGDLLPDGPIPGAEATPETVAEVGPDVLPEALPETVSEATPETVAEVTPEVGPDVLPEQVEPTCPTPDPPVAADGARTVLVTHFFTDEPGVCGRGLRALRLDAAGVLSGPGTVIDVGECPTEVAFSPDGRLALVLLNTGDPQAGTRGVAVLRHHANGSLEPVTVIAELAFRAVESLAFAPDGAHAYVTDGNIQGEGGVHVLDIVPGCTATYGRWIDLHHSSAIAMLPGGAYAAVMAGPVYNDDRSLAFVDLAAEGVAGHHVLFGDFVSAYTIGVHPGGRYLAVPNSSMFSDLANTLTVVTLTAAPGAAPQPAITQVVEDVETPTEVIYSPEGDRVLVTSFEGDRVRWWDVGGDGSLSGGGTITSVPLADRADMLRRGPNEGLVLVTAVTEVQTLRWTADGLVRDARLDLGEGSEHIVQDVAIEP